MRKKEKFKTKEKSRLKSLVPYYTRYKKLLFFTIFSCALFTILNIYATILKGNLLDSFTDFSAKNSINIALIMCIILVGVEIVTDIWSKIILKLNSKVDFDLKHKLLTSLMTLQVKNFDGLNTGMFVARINKDSMVLSQLFDEISDSLTTVLLNFSFIIISFFINVYMALFLLLNIVFFYFYENVKLKKYTIAYIEHKKNDEQVIGSYNEVIRGVRDIKNLNATDSIIEKIDGEQLKAIKSNLKRIDTRRSFNRLRDGIKHIFNFLFVLLSCYLIIKNKMSIGDFLILYVYKSNIIDFVKNLSNIREKLADGRVSANRVFEIIDGENFPRESFGNKEIKNIQGKIEFKGVCFNYSKKEKLFKDLNFVINPNQVVSFVGRSGEGKSTIIDLLNKNYLINKGNIFIDDIDLYDLSEKCLRQTISIVPQSPYIFNMTIAENLRLVKPEAKLDELKDVCKQAGLDDFIENMPDKYNTKVGENGISLSGGQKQRLAIARALLKESKIILFDEATSALDNETQDKIKNVIKNISKTHTVLVIAHRLSTIINSDCIYVLKDHKIVEFGTHKELLENSETYKNLYNNYDE